MSNRSMELSIRLTADARGLDRVLGSTQRGLDKTAAASRRMARSMADDFSRLHTALNGFSSATGLLGSYFGMQGARDAFMANMNFERDLMEMKQTAGLTIRQVAELKRIAIDSAKDTLQTPDQMLRGMMAYVRAGDKFDDIKQSIVDAGKSATVFRSTAEEIANMDFDFRDKMKLDPESLKIVRNMMYYHGNSGRFEPKELSRQAPILLNAVSATGIGGVQGANFTGALSQVLMKYSAITDPGMVSTLMQQGLGHIFNKAYVDNLQKTTGIDVKKYAPGGKFYGEGGVAGLLDLSDAMKAKGLQDPFKLSAAGFHDQETIKFFRALMQYSDQIRSEMKAAEKMAGANQIEVNLAEIKEAGFGKLKAAEIEVQRIKLSEPVSQASGGIAGLLGVAADHPLAAGALAVGGAMVGRLAWKKWRGDKPGLLEQFAGRSGGGGVQQVFVTNWPGSMLGPGEGLKQRREQRGGSGNTPGGAAPGSPASGPTRGARMKSGALGSLKYGAPLTAAIAAYDAWGIYQDHEMAADQKKLAYGRVAGGAGGSLGGAAIGGAIGALFGGVGAVPGALIGGAIGNMLGEAAGEALTKKAMAAPEQKVDVGGRLEIVAPEGYRVKNMKTNDPRFGFNVDSGPMTVGAF